jgi:hypothetical protein
MAHQLVLVLIADPRASIRDQVAALLAPHLGDPARPDLCFDYCVIGGRWNGIFAGMVPGAFDETDRFGGRVHDNLCRVEDLPEAFDPGSVITPDGRLHFFGWRFGDEPLDAEQAESWRTIRRVHGRLYAVAVDAHS